MFYKPNQEIKKLYLTQYPLDSEILLLFYF